MHSVNTTLSMLVKVAEHAAKHKNYIPPPIHFDVEEDKTFKKGEFIKIDLKTNPSVDDSKTYSFQIKLLHTATPEEILKFEDNFNMIVRGQNITAAGDKFGMMRNLLRGDALRVFESEAVTQLAGETDATFLACKQAVIKYSFPKNALAIQKRYMRRFMRKPRHATVREFFVRIYKMRNRMKQFPPFQMNQEIGIDELKEIIEFGAPSLWQREIYKQDFDVAARPIEDLVDFFERLEAAEKIFVSASGQDEGNGGRRSTKNNGQKASRSDTSDHRKRGAYLPAQPKNQNNRRFKRNKHNDRQDQECPLHGSDHAMGECKVLLAQAQKMKAQWQAQKSDSGRYKYRRGDRDEKPKYAKREANEIEEAKSNSVLCNSSDGNASGASKSSEASPPHSESSDNEELYNFEALSIKGSKRA